MWPHTGLMFRTGNHVLSSKQVANDNGCRWQNAPLDLTMHNFVNFN